jgi:hypothetical protein
VVRSAALLVALISVAIGVAGLVSPNDLMTLRRQYVGTPVGLYAVAAVRIAMGVVLLLAATTSRTPRLLRALGALMCLQGVAATILGVDRATAVIDWEWGMPTALLRVGAAMALATGGFIAFAVMTGSRPQSAAR